jgi:peptidoglycan hydrolase-like protein with peptidoglycan-binding domain
MKKIIQLAVGMAVFSLVSIAGAQNISISQDLALGSSGQDVISLQTFLMSKGFDIPALSNGSIPSGYFGGQTHAAVVRYQKSVGLPPTGYVGPLTRAKMSGGGISIGSANRLTMVVPNGDEKFVWGDWTIRWNPGTDTVTPVDLYLLRNMSMCSGGVCTPAAEQITPLAKSVANTGSVNIRVTSPSGKKGADGGNYYVRVCQKTAEREQRCDSSDKVFTITTQEVPATGELKITSPNGGETLVRGRIHTILWTSPQYFKAASADLKLIPVTPSCAAGAPCADIAVMPAYMIATNLDITKNTHRWTVGSAFTAPGGVVGERLAEAVIPDGQYSIEICETGTSNCDTTDGRFTITTIPSIAPSISIISPNGGQTYGAGAYMRVNVNVVGDSTKLGNKIIFSLVDAQNNQTPVHTYVDSVIPGSQTIQVPISSRTPGGSYRLMASLMSGNQVQAQDYSDTAITLTSWGESCPSGYVCDPLVF